MTGDTRTRARGASARALVAVGTAAFVAGGALTVQAGAARGLEPVPDNGMDGHLVLSQAMAGTTTIAPSAPGRWQIATDVTTDDRVSLDLELVSSGPLVDRGNGLTLGVEACDVAWQQLETTTPRCATGERVVVDSTRASSFGDDVESAAVAVHSAEGAGEVFLLVSLGVTDEVPSDGASTTGLSARVGVGITATALDLAGSVPVEPETPADGGAPAQVPSTVDPADATETSETAAVAASSTTVRDAPSGALAFTGAAASGPALAGAGALLVGLGLQLRGRRRGAVR